MLPNWESEPQNQPSANAAVWMVFGLYVSRIGIAGWLLLSSFLVIDAGGLQATDRRTEARIPNERMEIIFLTITNLK